MSRDTAAGFGEVLEAVRRVVEARGVRREGESMITYSEASVTPPNEREVRTEACAVFRARHTGGLSGGPGFKAGRLERGSRMNLQGHQERR